MTALYLDHAATTPMQPAVIEEMTTVMAEIFGNPSSVHHFGRSAQQKLETCREVIADSLGVRAHEIIFNSGGTEGDNAAILMTAFARQNEGKHLITTAIEHPAVLRTMEFLAQQGFSITYLPVNEKGQLDVAEVKNALRPDTILVSIMTANNETGNLLPIKEIGALLKDHPAYFHTDAVQAYGKMALTPTEDHIDLLSISAHKINGPKGVGFLYKSARIQLPPLLHGGEQEEKQRAGTENLAGIAGMTKAITLLTAAAQAENTEKYQTFADLVLTTLRENHIDFQLNGDPAAKMPHILNLRFNGVNNNLLLMQLDLKGVAISTGSACTAGNVEPSHVLAAMYGADHPAIKESIRISFGLGNTLAEIQQFSQLLVTIVKKYQS